MKYLRDFHPFRSDAILLSLMVWLCALPLIGIFVWPFFGGRVALIAAGLLLVLALLACWGICGWAVYRENKS